MDKPYDDIQELVEIGYLTHNLVIQGVPIILRSLFPQEAKEITLQSYGMSFIKYQQYIVARSLFSVRGQVICERWVSPELVALVETLPSAILSRLYYEIQGLLSRYSRCFKLVEGFSYEPHSRTLWFSNGRAIPKNPFGLENGIQQLWQVLNHYDDLRDHHEENWSNTKFLGSAFSPKGLKKIYQKDKDSKREEKARREKKIQECIAKYLGHYIPTDQEKQDTPVLVSAKSEEELMEEYHRWIRGEKDRHDLIVDDYKNKIRQKMADQKQEYEDKLSELENLEETRGIFASTQLAPATKEQLEQAGFRKGVRTLQGESQRNRLYNRYLGNDEVHGDFYVGSDGKVKMR